MSHADNASPFDASEYAKGIRATVPYFDAFHSETIALVKALKPDVETWLDFIYMMEVNNDYDPWELQQREAFLIAPRMGRRHRRLDVRGSEYRGAAL